MASSTRVGKTGTLEVHLKKNLEVSSEVVSQIPQLPTSDPWVLVVYNPNSDRWQNAMTFDSFNAADDRFVTLCHTNGLDKADRMAVGVPDDGPRGRVIE